MLQIKNLTLAYGPKILVQDANLQLYKNQRVGLVGKNGCGKTSFFKLILGTNQPEVGECELPNHTLISYIEQEIEAQDIAIIEYVLLAHRIYAEEHTDLPEYYQLRPNAEKLLINLGFGQHELEKPLREFSGGWQMRANLAKALFCPSDLLLLDEPTNHLDIETVMWLETWLDSYQGLAVIISHDREFLDNVTTHTLYIANQKATLYGGNYSNFERTFSEQSALQQRMESKAQAKIAHLQSFVDRFKAKASKAKQAQSRMKMIEKLQFSPTLFSNHNYSIEFFEPEITPNLLLTVIDAKIGYPDKELISSAKIQIFANDRIGLLGKNGRGKTSLIKAILDGSSLLSGTVEMSQKIKVGYFAQQTIDMLDDNETPFGLISRTDKKMRHQEVYNYLGRFGFASDISQSSVAKFSGGEKARLILASIILTKPNILFLDEPTNHLDMTMREELATALQDFNGAVILVSHDKFLLQSVVDDFYLVDKKQLQPFSGTLDDYHEYLLKEESDAKKKPSKQDTNSASDIAAQFKLNNQLRHQVGKLEKEIGSINTKISKLEAKLEIANNGGNSGELEKLQQEINNLKINLSKTEEEWLEKTELLDK
ncbi:MAG: ATP-binding cassette domain-containing protein [Burkholderiales bacterium]|nr:ATP-binding cassette domain-containing protein [Burkholderiales bacterium]